MRLDLKDDDIIRIIKSPAKPDIEAILTLVEKYSIKTATDLWDIYDQVLVAWHSKKDLDK